MNVRFRVRTLLFSTFLIALFLAVIAPDVYKAQRRASACYVLGEVVRPGAWKHSG